MANNESNSPQKVNPFLIILLGIVIVGGGIYWFTSQPKAPTSVAIPPVANEQPVDQTNPQTPLVTADTNQEVKNNKNVGNDENSGISVLSLNRNPFLTPSIYLTSSSTNSNSEPVSKAPTTITPQSVITPIEETKGPELRLGAVFSKNGDKLALVYYNNKGNILRQNDVLKGTRYALKAIELNSVTLVEDNGAEITLRLEKTIPKGGA